MLLWNLEQVICGMPHRVYAAVVRLDGIWRLRQGGFGKVSESELTEDEAKGLLDASLDLGKDPLFLAAFNSPTLISILDSDDRRYDTVAC